MTRLQRVLVWCGFTPTAREGRLLAQLRQERAAVDDYRRTVLRVERLLHFREAMGAQTIDTQSLRDSLAGELGSR